MFKKSILLTVAALSLGGFVSLTQSASMPGSLTYHKTSSVAKIGSQYKSFKLTNHIPTSNFKNIKTISWKKSGLKKGTKVRIDLYATQGTQFNWYRISKYSTKKANKTNKKVQKYWIYGQALVLPTTTSNQLALSY